MEDHDAIQQKLTSSDVSFSNTLSEIMNLSRKFSLIAEEHDVNEEIRMNGYRSMILLTNKYFAQLRSGLEARAPNTNVEQFRAAAPTLVALMSIMLSIHDKMKSGDDSSLEDFTKLLQFTETDVQPFHSEIRGFYLPPGLRHLMNGVVMGIVLTNISFYNLPNILWDPQAKGRLFTRLALDGTMEEIRNLWGPAELGILRLVHWSKFLFYKGYMEQITCPRQLRFVISKEGLIGSDATTSITTSSESISIAYLKQSELRESLIFHCHGGGYLSSTYRSHEAYMREWGRKLGVPIVCCNYRLCPEHPYPASLQDLLDAYLFLTSGSSQVLTKIGFHPKNIIVTGDSAGGNLALSLVLALNQIRDSDPQILMPVAIALQYPNGNPAFESSCSRAMSLIDPTITLSGLGQAAGAYYGVGNTGPESWFRSEEYEKIAAAMINKMKTDPLYNPLISTRYTDLQNIKLFIMAAEFDPLIDDAVAIGRVWKGPLVMDLAQGLPHSFMSYAGVPEVSDALDVIIARIAQGLGMTLVPEGCL